MMKLYHGTDNYNLIEIFKAGYLDNEVSGETTLEIDKIIEEFSGENFTKDALYLTSDIYATDGYDYAIPLYMGADLDEDDLYVADNRIRDEILGCSKKDVDLMKEIVARYKASFIPYEDYLEIEWEYNKKHFPEFLYFGTVDIEFMDEEILEYLEGIEDEDIEEELAEFLE